MYSLLYSYRLTNFPKVATFGKFYFANYILKAFNQRLISNKVFFQSLFYTPVIYFLSLQMFFSLDSSNSLAYNLGFS